MNDLLDEIYPYLEGATRYDRYIYALCAFHDDHRPSLAIYPDTYWCASCGARGKTANLLDDLRKKQGLYIAPKREISFHSPWSRWDKIYGDLDNIIYRAHRNLIKQNKTVYLKKRGITVDTMEELKLGWLDDWITFPILNQYGDIMGATARCGETNTSPAKYCNVPNQNPDLLYVTSWEMVNTQNTIFLVFGIIDAITLYQCGYASISTTTGKRLNHTALDWLRKSIVIIPDRGEEVEAALLSAKLGWRGKAKKVQWPDNCKDINNVFCHYGKDELLKVLGV